MPPLPLDARDLLNDVLQQEERRRQLAELTAKVRERMGVKPEHDNIQPIDCIPIQK